MRYLVQMEEGTYGSFTELVAWQKCRAFRKAISMLVKEFPQDEKFRLTDQLIRASRGPSANIAEGFGRFSEKDNVRFCRMAKSSLFESQDHLSAAFDEKYIDKATLNLHWALPQEAIRIINGYIRHLKRFEPPGTGVSEPSEPYGEDIPIFAPGSDDLELNDDKELDH